MKKCGHDNESVQGCDICYIVKLKKRVERLLVAEYTRLNRIVELEKAAQDVVEAERQDSNVGSHLERAVDALAEVLNRRP